MDQEPVGLEERKPERGEGQGDAGGGVSLLLCEEVEGLGPARKEEESAAPEEPDSGLSRSRIHLKA